MIIDTHTHFYDPFRPQGVPWPPVSHDLLYRTVLPDDYRRLAEPLGITGTVVVEASEWLEDNQWLLDLAEEEAFVVGVVGHVDPCNGGFADSIAHFARNPLFRGIRLGGHWFTPSCSSEFFSDMACLADAGLVVEVLGDSSHVDGVVALAQRFPGLRIVMNHMARVRIDGRQPQLEWADAMARLAACPSRLPSEL